MDLIELANLIDPEPDAPVSADPEPVPAPTPSPELTVLTVLLSEVKGLRADVHALTLRTPDGMGPGRSSALPRAPR
jgi:hypothetical protein